MELAKIGKKGQLTIPRSVLKAADTLAWAAAQGLPPKDAPILAAAIDARCHLLVTGDRAHFGRLFGRQLRGTVVALPVDALRIVIGD
jgi:hypothetical protein